VLAAVSAYHSLGAGSLKTDSQCAAHNNNRFYPAV
jgi:hypothetical protein